MAFTQFPPAFVNPEHYFFLISNERIQAEGLCLWVVVVPLGPTELYKVGTQPGH